MFYSLPMLKLCSYFMLFNFVVCFDFALVPILKKQVKEVNTLIENTMKIINASNSIEQKCAEYEKLLTAENVTVDMFRRSWLISYEDLENEDYEVCIQILKDIKKFKEGAVDSPKMRINKIVDLLERIQILKSRFSKYGMVRELRPRPREYFLLGKLNMLPDNLFFQRYYR
uniref:Uncharacterized protein n=1 Tax=Clastoptera arizonana TaxID=38151 RepID=A0A1B6DMP9_9HEMI